MNSAEYREAANLSPGRLALCFRRRLGKPREFHSASGRVGKQAEMKFRPLRGESHTVSRRLQRLPGGHPQLNLLALLRARSLSRSLFVALPARSLARELANICGALPVPMCAGYLEAGQVQRPPANHWNSYVCVLSLSSTCEYSHNSQLTLTSGSSSLPF